jgi:hypothetical protein
MKRVLSLLSLVLLLGATLQGQQRLTPKGVMPINAYAFIPMDQFNLVRLMELKESGINLVIDNFPSIESMKKGLDIAAQAGVKLLISCPELRTNPESTARLFMHHTAMGGYYIYDEPQFRLFPELKAWCERIQKVDKKSLLYVNIWPIFAGPDNIGTKGYREYVRTLVKELPIQVLSFDFYPVLANRISKSWFENLELIADEAQKANIPFWAFALTSNYDQDHIMPQTLAALRLQSFSNLAYGAQGICYYEYWDRTKETASQEDDRGGPLNSSGKRTVVFDRIKMMSAEIQALAPVFLGSKVISIRHTGKGMIPTGTIRLTTLPRALQVLETNGAPALVSVLENGPDTYVVIVNKDHLNAINLIVSGDKTLKRILKDGSIVPAEAYENSMELDPGDISIFSYPTVPNKTKL